MAGVRDGTEFCVDGFDGIARRGERIMVSGWRLHGELEDMRLGARPIGDLSRTFEKPGGRRQVEADRKPAWPDGEEVMV